MRHQSSSAPVVAQHAPSTEREEAAASAELDAGAQADHGGGFGVMMALQQSGGNQAVVQLQEAPAEETTSSEEAPASDVAPEAEVASAPAEPIIPSLSQGDVPSCGISSLISAFMIWDAFEEGQPLLSRALAMAAVQVPAHGSELTALSERVASGERLDEATYQQVSDWLLTAHAGPGEQGDERDLSPREIEQAAEQLLAGALSELNRTTITSFDEIWVQAGDLSGGDILSVSWVLRTGEAHAFLIGRLPDGVPNPWFLADQRRSPTITVRESSASALEAHVRGMGEYRMNPLTMMGSAAVILMRPQPPQDRQSAEDAVLNAFWDRYGWD